MSWRPRAPGGVSGPTPRRVTLPDESEFPPALADFFQMLGLPRQREQFARLQALGLNTDSDLERSLGRRVVESTQEA